MLKHLKNFCWHYNEGEVVNKNEYLFVKVGELDVDAFLHCNDLTYLNNGEEELAKYKKETKLRLKF